MYPFVSGENMNEKGMRKFVMLYEYIHEWSEEWSCIVFPPEKTEIVESCAMLYPDVFVRLDVLAYVYSMFCFVRFWERKKNQCSNWRCGLLSGRQRRRNTHLYLVIGLWNHWGIFHLWLHLAKKRISVHLWWAAAFLTCRTCGLCFRWALPQSISVR